MELSRIDGFLDRYKKLLFKNEEKIKKICLTIFEVTGIEIKEKEVNVRNGNIYIIGNSVVRNEIFLYKDRIIEALKLKNLTEIFDIY